MLLESDEPPDAPGPVRTGLARLTSSAGGSLHDDIERLIAVAGQLFMAIEVHIHQMDEELTFAERENVMPSPQTVFKERLIRTAASLNESLHEVAVHLEGHDVGPKYGRRQGDRPGGEAL